MKKIITFLFLIGSMSFLEATPLKSPNKNLTQEQIELLEKMETRMDEIKAMDFNSMSKEEIKAVKSEMKEMKKEAERKGVYLSVGAIIIISVLLLIILL